MQALVQQPALPIPTVASREDAQPRTLFIDNVRWAMIVLVLGMHSAVTYSPVGSWYYTEHPRLGPAATLFFVTFQGVLQGFFMSLLFFIAGAFAVRSYDAKGAAAFMRGRLRRLGLPTLFYVLLLGPLTEYYVAHSWRTQESFAHEMGLYVLRGRFLGGTGPMWFCAALLIFCAAYALVRSIAPGKTPAAASGPVTGVGVLAAVVALTATTFAARLAFPIGTAVFNMQLCYFPAYAILFGLGLVAGRAAWLRTTPDEFCWKSGGLCVGLAMLAWLPLLALGGALEGRTAAYAGGATWQSVALSLWEALICVGMSLLVLAAFRRWLSGQGRLTRFLSDNAFAVYVLHPPILVGLAVMMSDLPLPPMGKFVLLWTASLAACFGLVAPLARRIPGLGGILA